MSKGTKFITVKNPPYVSAGETKKCFHKPHLNWIGQKLLVNHKARRSTPLALKKIHRNIRNSNNLQTQIARESEALEDLLPNVVMPAISSINVGRHPALGMHTNIYSWESRVTPPPKEGMINQHCPLIRPYFKGGALGRYP